MTTSVLKIKIKDPNTYNIQRTLFIRTKHNMRFLGLIPCIKLQNDT